MTADGREIGRFRPAEQAKFELIGKPREYSSAALPAVKATVMYPCGSREIPFRVMFPPDLTSERLKQSAEQGKQVQLMFTGFAPDETFAAIWVDKPADTTIRLAVGMDERTIGPGSAREPSELFVFQNCDGGRNVYLDGKEIGELPPDTESYVHTAVGVAGDDTKEGRGNVFLVDVSASHCYKAGYLSYRPEGHTVGPAPRFSRILRPAAFHRLEQIQRPDYFLEEPPAKIVASDLLLAFRDYVYRIGC